MMKSAWVERDAQHLIDEYAPLGISRRAGAARLHHAPARRRSQAGAARRRQHLVEDEARDLDGERGRCALCQRLRLGHGDDRARRACRPCGSSPCAPARPRGSKRRGLGARAARPPPRSAGAHPFGRDAAACLHAAGFHRPHPCHRGAEPDRPAERRTVRRSVRRPARLRSLFTARLRTGAARRAAFDKIRRSKA